MDKLVRFVFVLYCATVGAVLVLIPWSPGWERMVSHLPATFEILRLPLLRGALTGFGLVHLVWCAHDLLLFLGADIPDGNRHAASRSRDPGQAPAGPGEAL